MEATAETVEERLRDLQDRGLLGDDELDDHAQAALRKADPDIAMEALAQWERSSHKRRNPSACMVSLLKKLNDQGLDHLVDAYLERLQLCRCSPSLESLQDLLSAHVDRIAYENLDVQLQRARPPLSFEESVKRVALRGRGGDAECTGRNLQG
eukprot:g7017.t1